MVSQRRGERRKCNSLSALIYPELKQCVWPKTMAGHRAENNAKALQRLRGRRPRTVDAAPTEMSRVRRVASRESHAGCTAVGSMTV